MRPVLAIFLCSLFAGPLWAASPKQMCSTGKWGPVRCISADHYIEDVCSAIEDFSQRHQLDPNFFARLIWQESGFDPNAVSPVGAQGIAQFMPGTAKLRGLKDPFNPAAALEHSAQYLAEMTRQYGNIGLAAVGYNGGETRAEELLRGTDNLAFETIDYVQAVTSQPYQKWINSPTPKPDLRLSKALKFQDACLDLARNKNMVTFQRPKRQLKPWGIQVAFGATQSRAMAKFHQMTRSCKNLIGDEEPDLIFRKSRASSRRGYFLARLGRNSDREARSDCAKYRESGCICAVFKN